METAPVRQVRVVAPTVPKENNPPLVEEMTPEAEQKLFSFIQEQTAKMSRYAALNNSEGQIGFYELNRALAEYQNINLALISLGVMAKVEYSKAKEAFEDWYAEKYITERNILNPPSVSSTKWYAAKEIEMHVRHKYKKEYKELLMEQEFAEHKVALLRRLQDSWTAHQFVLARLSRNVEADLRGSSTKDSGPKFDED